ncbi:MAG: hypothetical protein IT168_03080 [Bryobacterales bacterium]|nr:hypothetical protein [Bryobacterales bacterium]
MPPRSKRADAAAPVLLTGEQCSSAEPIADIPGPGRWMVFDFAPVALFSLKASQATSTVGRTLLVPTPYVIKMAVVDACLRAGWLINGPEADKLVRDLAACELRIGVPDRALVTHTIVKVRQEPKARKPGVPYISNVAYREFVHYKGPFRIAINLTTCTQTVADLLPRAMPAVTYLGKRGCFVQFLQAQRTDQLSIRFTQPLGDGMAIPIGVHLAWLDDFGPEANFDALNSYSDTPIKRNKHRKFVQTLVPLGRVRSGPGFTEYEYQAEALTPE